MKWLIIKVKLELHAFYNCWIKNSNRKNSKKESSRCELITNKLFAEVRILINNNVMNIFDILHRF